MEPLKLVVILSYFILIVCCVKGQQPADSVRQVPSRGRKLLFFPVVARSVETGWSFGAATASTFRLSKFDTVSRTSNLQGLALYSLKKQLITAINGSIYFPRETYILDHQLSYSYFPDKFWGLGPHAPDSAEEPYNFKQYYIYLHLRRKLAKNLFAGILYEQQNVLHMDYKEGGLFDREKVPGRHGYFVSGLGMSLTLDSRDNAFAPDKGVFAQLYFNHFARYLGSQFTYTNLVVDLRKYLRVYRGQVLAMQFFNFFNFGGAVPVRSLASFGGANSMRGYYSGRYKDKQQIVFQSEYRVPVYGKFGLVIFGGVGDVAHKPMHYDLSTLKYSYGGGVRFALNKSEKLNLRLDYGITSENHHGLYFQLGEAF